jgi:hypothetical protein
VHERVGLQNAASRSKIPEILEMTLLEIRRSRATLRACCSVVWCVVWVGGVRWLAALVGAT